jgi:hypothetical protein
MAAAIALGTLIIILAGISAWIIVAVSTGSRREDRNRNLRLTAQAADKASKRVRLLTGLYVRDVIRTGATRQETTFV